MIQLRNVSRRYGERTAVNAVDLDIPGNTIYGIIGKSGAGKSTLIRLISLLEKPDSGEIRFGEDRVDNLTGNALIGQRRKIGMIFQNFNLLGSRTAGGNIAYPLEISGKPRKETERRVQELLELVGLEGRGNAPVSTLSGGQKQRVAIARALAVEPDILFCDEATSALDPQTTRSILELLKNLQKNMNLSIVMITHQMEVVRDACRSVAVLDEGKIAETGLVADIFSRPQAAVTREFLTHLNPLESIAESSCPDLVRWSHEGGAYILRFRGAVTGEPVLSRLARKFDIDVNIRAGGVQDVSGTAVGTMIADLAGKPGEVAQARAWLESQGVSVEENNE